MLRLIEDWDNEVWPSILHLEVKAIFGGSGYGLWCWFVSLLFPELMVEARRGGKGLGQKRLLVRYWRGLGSNIIVFRGVVGYVWWPYLLVIIIVKKFFLSLFSVLPRRLTCLRSRCLHGFHSIELQGKQLHQANSRYFFLNCWSCASGLLSLHSLLIGGHWQYDRWSLVFFDYQRLNWVVFGVDGDSFWLRVTAARIGTTTPITTVLVMSCRSGLFLEWP